MCYYRTYCCCCKRGLSGRVERGCWEGIRLRCWRYLMDDTKRLIIIIIVGYTHRSPQLPLKLLQRRRREEQWIFQLPSFRYRITLHISLAHLPKPSDPIQPIDTSESNIRNKSKRTTYKPIPNALHALQTLQTPPRLLQPMKILLKNPTRARRITHNIIH